MAEVTHIAILEKEGDEVVELPEHIAVSKLMNLNRYEFNFLRTPLLIAYEFFNPDLMIDDATRIELEILAGLSRRSEKVFSLKKPIPRIMSKHLFRKWREGRMPTAFLLPLSDRKSLEAHRLRESFSLQKKKSSMHSRCLMK